MRFRLLALIALIAGLSRLALSAEITPPAAAAVGRQPKTFAKKNAWSGPKRVTRRRTVERPKATMVPLMDNPQLRRQTLMIVVPSIGVPTPFPAVPEALAKVNTDSKIAVTEPSREIRALARAGYRGRAALPEIKTPSPARGHWSAANLTAEYQPRLVSNTRDIAFGDPRFVHDQQFRLRVSIRI